MTENITMPVLMRNVYATKCDNEIAAYVIEIRFSGYEAWKADEDPMDVLMVATVWLFASPTVMDSRPAIDPLQAGRIVDGYAQSDVAPLPPSARYAGEAYVGTAADVARLMDAVVSGM